jgi:hypothetical protein
MLATEVAPDGRISLVGLKHKSAGPPPPLVKKPLIGARVRAPANAAPYSERALNSSAILIVAKFENVSEIA